MAAHLSGDGHRERIREWRIVHASACSPHGERVKAALARVIASSAFQSSHRAQEFLTYVVEQALAGDPGQLKERCIGAAVFGRAPGYDTGSDAVVRVAANDVRKRLLRYYLDAGDAEVVFHLPAGCYVPEIRLPGPVVSEPAATEQPTGNPRQRRWQMAAIAGWSACLVFAMLWVWGSSGHARQEVPHLLPWSVLFDSGHTTELVMADSSMGVLRDLKTFPVSLEDYAYRRFLNPLPGLPPDVAGSWRLIAEKRLTSTADARIASQFLKMAAIAGRSAVIRSARDLQLSDFRRGDNLVLLGSAASNPWVELFQEQLDFQIQMDPEQPRQVVQIRRPHPRDPTGSFQSISTGKTGESYGSLALVRGLDGKGRVLIAQGTSMEGTDVAGEVALDAEYLAGLLRGCGVAPTNREGRFEILLRLSATAGGSRAHEVVAVHCHQK